MGRLRQTSIRWKPELKKQVEHVLVERDMSLQAAIDEALELWLATKAGTGTAKGPAAPDLQVNSGDSDINSQFAQFSEKLEQMLEVFRKVAGEQGYINPEKAGDPAKRMARLPKPEAEIDRLTKKYVDPGKRVRGKKTKHPGQAEGRSADK